MDRPFRFLAVPLYLVAVVGFLFAAASLLLTVKYLLTSDSFSTSFLAMQTLIVAVVSKGLWILARHLDSDPDGRHVDERRR